MDAVRFQFIFLGLVMIMTVLLMAESVVLETVDMCSVCLVARSQSGEKWGMFLSRSSGGSLYVRIPSAYTTLTDHEGFPLWMTDREGFLLRMTDHEGFPLWMTDHEGFLLL